MPPTKVTTTTTKTGGGGVLSGGIAKIQSGLAGKPLAPTTKGGPAGPHIIGMPGAPMYGRTQREVIQQPRPLTPYEGPNQPALAEVPNYDKLTRLERWIMDQLPGIPKGVTDALQAFGDSPVGKVLGWLDIPAEGIERGAGFAAQALYAFDGVDGPNWKEFQKNAKAAWYAGNLTADLANIPLFEIDTDTTQPIQQYQVRASAPGLAAYAGSEAAGTGTTVAAGFNIGGFGIRARLTYGIDDLPGMAGVVAARQRIAQLMAQGVDAKTALATARDEQYQKLGALQLRAQMQDLFMHLAGDPLNLIDIAAPLKLVERAQLMRKGILATKIADVAPYIEKVAKAEQSLTAAQEALRVVEAAGGTARAIDRAEGAVKAADKVMEASDEFATAMERANEAVRFQDEVESMLKAAEDVGDSNVGELRKAVKSAQDEVQRSIDEVNKAKKYLDETEKAAKATTGATVPTPTPKAADAEAARAGVTTAETALKSAQDELKAAERARLTPMDQFVLRVTGGIDAGEGAARKANIFDPRTWFSLTPSARASEFVNIIQENINSRLLMAMRQADGSYDVAGIARAIQRAADGTIGKQFGHIIATIEGQHVRSVLQGITERVGDVARAYAATDNFERPLLNAVSSALGANPITIVKRIEKGEAAAVFAQFMRRIDASKDGAKLLDELLAANNLTRQALSPQIFEAALKVFSGDAKTLVNSQATVAKIMSDIADVAMKNAVARFGVEQRGFWMGMSEIVKQAETLAFLRLNPVYPFKNFFNNVTTMIARGVFGFFGPGDVGKFWAKEGGLPGRLAEAVGAIGDLKVLDVGEAKLAQIAAGQISPVAAGTDVAMKILDDAQKFKTGWIDKVVDSIRNAGPKYDFGTLAQKIETWSSGVAFTTAYVRGKQYYNRTGQIWNHLADFDPAIARMVGPDVARDIEKLAEAAGFNPAKLDELARGDNLRLTFPALQGAVEKRIGMPLNAVLDDMTIQKLGDELPDILARGNQTEIDAFMDGIKAQVDRHIQGLHDEAMDILIEEVAGRVKVEGPQAYSKVWGDAIDDWYASHEKHSIDMTQVSEEIRRGEDPAAKSVLWRKALADGEQYWGRSWDRLEARMKGLTRAAEESKLAVGGDAIKMFDDWRDGWKGFFDYRNKEISAFFDAATGGGKPKRAWADIVDDLNGKYDQMVKAEDKAMRNLDALTGQMLPDGPRATWLAGRDRIAKLRAADRKMVADFRQSLKNIAKEDIPAAFAAHWEKRRQVWTQQWYEERSLIGAMQGNPQAAQRIAKDVEKYTATESGVLAILDKKLSGQALTPQEEKALETFVGTNADPATQGYLKSLRAELANAQAGQADAAAVQKITGSQLDPQALKDYGWDRGKRGALNAVNKDRAMAGLPKYAKLDDAPLDEVMAAIDKRLGKSVTAEKVITRPRSELPKNLSDEIEFTARRLSDELFSGNPPTLYKVDAGSVESIAEETRRTVSSLPDWFQDLAKKYHIGREDVYKAIDKIIKDKGADKGKTVERVKQVISDAMTKTNPLTGEPPDPAILRLLGRPEDEIQAAEAAWRALGAEPPGIDLGGDATKAIRELEDEIAATEKQVLESLRKQTVSQFDESAGAVMQPTTQQFMPDFEALKKPEAFYGQGLDELWYNRGREVVNALTEEGTRIAKGTPLKWADLSPEAQAGLQRYLEHVKGGFADARYASVRYGEYGRDSALLNYNRRTNFDTWASAVFPYSFWGTHSMWKWALHSIDRHAMLAAYYRYKQFISTAYRPEQNLPARLQGKIRIPLPFMPDWMGDEVFFDPMRTLLPFDTFISPLEAAHQQELGDQGATKRALIELLNDGEINQAQYDSAVKNLSGPEWERAEALAQQDDTEGRLNGVDFAMMLSSPHVPLRMAWDMMKSGDISLESAMPNALFPMTNTIGSVLSAFGLDPVKYNPEAAIREKLGLNPFSKWDDYYTDRMLANMAAEGLISADEARRAMIEREGEAYDTARQRAFTEKSGGPAGAFMGMIGMPVKAYPPGEEHLRLLQDDYNAAVMEYERTGDYASTIGKFKEQYPEYEARLALYDPPEKRLQKFMVDNLWDKWNDLPDVTQRELIDALGPEFEEKFIDKATRSYANITPETMAVWLKIMGGDPVNVIDVPYVPPVKLTDKDVAWKAQVFYDTRARMFPNYQELAKEMFAIPKEDRVYVAPQNVVKFYQERQRQFPNHDSLQDTYYNLPKNQRKQFLQANPELKAYFDWKGNYYNANPDVAAYIKSDAPITKSARSVWIDQHPQYKQYLEWRKDWMLRNPNVAPYVTDNISESFQKELDQAAQQTGANQPNFTLSEWRQTLGWPLTNLVLDYARGDPLPAAAQEQLEQAANQYGWQGTVEEFAEFIAGSQP